MHIVILEQNNRLADSLKRCLEHRFPCTVESSFDPKSFSDKYQDGDFVFLVNEIHLSKNEISNEGINNSRWIQGTLKKRAVVYGLNDPGESGITYIKVPFSPFQLIETIQKSTLTSPEIDPKYILKFYEYFRSKISHDYLQYCTKNKQFFRSLNEHFFKYTEQIFGIDLSLELKLSPNDMKKAFHDFEDAQDSSILHDFLVKLKLETLSQTTIKDHPENIDIFFDNIRNLTEVLSERKDPPSNLEEKIAENFMLSWYIWRKMFFLKKYESYFADGYFEGCFRLLLSIKRPYFKELRREALTKIFNTNNVTDSIKELKKKNEELHAIIKKH